MIRQEPFFHPEAGKKKTGTASVLTCDIAYGLKAVNSPLRNIAHISDRCGYDKKTAFFSFRHNNILTEESEGNKENNF